MLFRVWFFSFKSNANLQKLLSKMILCQPVLLAGHRKYFSAHPECRQLFFSAVYRHLRKYLNEDIVKELIGDAHAVAELEREWEQLSEDRLALRQIFPSGESKVPLAGFVFLPTTLMCRCASLFAVLIHFLIVKVNLCSVLLGDFSVCQWENSCNWYDCQNYHIRRRKCCAVFLPCQNRHKLTSYFWFLYFTMHLPLLYTVSTSAVS